MQVIPLSRNRPQKLLIWRRSTSCFAPSELQALLISHLSWILWRFPFSDSFNIAVDMSIARGESRGNAWKKQKKIVLWRVKQTKTNSNRIGIYTLIDNLCPQRKCLMLKRNKDLYFIYLNFWISKLTFSLKKNLIHI